MFLPQDFYGKLTEKWVATDMRRERGNHEGNVDQRPTDLSFQKNAAFTRRRKCHCTSECMLTVLFNFVSKLELIFQCYQI